MIWHCQIFFGWHMSPTFPYLPQMYHWNCLAIQIICFWSARSFIHSANIYLYLISALLCHPYVSPLNVMMALNQMTSDPCLECHVSYVPCTYHQAEIAQNGKRWKLNMIQKGNTWLSCWSSLQVTKSQDTVLSCTKGNLGWMLRKHFVPREQLSTGMLCPGRW